MANPVYTKPDGSVTGSVDNLVEGSDVEIVSPVDADGNIEVAIASPTTFPTSNDTLEDRSRDHLGALQEILTQLKILNELIKTGFDLDYDERDL